MAFVHGKNAKVLLNQYDLSGYFNESTVTRMAETGETTTYGAGSKTFIAGLGDGKAALKGLFDGAAGALDAIINPLLGSNDQPATIAPSGLALGAPVFTLLALPLTYEVSTPVGDVVSVALELDSDGPIDRGVALAGLRATAFATTDNAPGVDNTVGSVNGGFAVAHISAYSLTAGAVTVKVQHSLDNITFADLATLTTGSAVGGFVATVAAGTAVNRYLRAQVTTTGTAGSVTTTLSFARR